MQALDRRRGGFDSVDPRHRSTVEKHHGGFSSASPVYVGHILNKSPVAVPHAGGQSLEEVDRDNIVKKSPEAVPHAGGVGQFLEEVDRDSIVKKSPTTVPHSVEDSDAGHFLEGPLTLDDGICGRGQAGHEPLCRGGRAAGRASFVEVIRRNARGHGQGSS